MNICAKKVPIMITHRIRATGDESNHKNPELAHMKLSVESECIGAFGRGAFGSGWFQNFQSDKVDIS